MALVAVRRKVKRVVLVHSPINTAADSHIGRVRTQVHALLRSIHVDLTALETAIETGDHAGLYAALTLPPDAPGLVAALAVCAQSGAVAGAGQIRAAITKAAKKLAGMTLDFALVNQRSVDWAHRHGGALVREVNDEQRRVVADLTARGIREGIPPRTTARTIRDSVGLTQRQANAVHNYGSALDRAIAGGKSADWLKGHYALSPLRGDPARVTPERRDKLVADYADRQRKWRSENIARSETIRASNQGQLDLWREMADKGYLDRATAQKVWSSAPDACPECAELDGQVVGFEDLFTGQGEDTADAPPAHPSCR